MKILLQNRKKRLSLHSHKVDFKLNHSNGALVMGVAAYRKSIYNEKNIPTIRKKKKKQARF